MSGETHHAVETIVNTTIACATDKGQNLTRWFISKPRSERLTGLGESPVNRLLRLFAPGCWTNKMRSYSYTCEYADDRKITVFCAPNVRSYGQRSAFLAEFGGAIPVAIWESPTALFFDVRQKIFRHELRTADAGAGGCEPPGSGA